MSYNLQNFYKSSLSLDWSIGLGNFYVSTKPTISAGWLVISPNNSNLREIVKYTSTGTDGNGDYVVVSARGVGGTTEQTHTVGEPIRMNITAELWAAMNEDITNIVASGVPNANTTTMGGVEVATEAEFQAGIDIGSTGASLMTTPSIIKTKMANQALVEVLDTEATRLGSYTTRFDITNPSGTTFRYTFDGTGTNPNINTTTCPIGALIEINISSSAGNNGIFVITGSGTNYFEITNPSGAAEVDKTISEGYIQVSNLSWTKNPLGKLFLIETYGAGGGGSGGTNHTGTVSVYTASGGGGGGYNYRLFKSSELTESTYKYMVGSKGLGGVGVANGSTGVTTAQWSSSGGTSILYPLIRVYGGGGGLVPTNDASGGGGGSLLERGKYGSTASQIGTTPWLFTYLGSGTAANSLNYQNIGWGGAGSIINTNGACAEKGGASGAGGGSYGGNSGGSSLFAGAGGGAGGRQTGTLGGFGGIRGSYTVGGGPAAGTVNTGLPSPDGVNPGDGGTGGSGSTTAGIPGGAGGNGARQGGGGGGGGSSQNNGGGGNGGNGGRGEIIITTFF